VFYTLKSNFIFSTGYFIGSINIANVMLIPLTISTEIRQPKFLSKIILSDPSADPTGIPKLKTLFARLSIYVCPKYELIKLILIGTQPE
jgi:hypothetical protein